MRALLLLSAVWLALSAAPQREARFEPQQIRDDFGVGYAVTVADVNGDKKPDIVASGRATRNIKIYWNESIGKGKP